MRASLVAQLVKNLPAMQATWVWSLGWEDPLEKGTTTHSSILTWKLPWIQKDGCWSWNSNTMATWCEELTHWKRPWCWERLRAGGEGDDRGWDGWMASPTWWTWVWASSRSWWWIGRPGLLQSMGSQRVGQDWVTFTFIPLSSSSDLT